MRAAVIAFLAVAIGPGVASAGDIQVDDDYCADVAEGKYPPIRGTAENGAGTGFQATCLKGLINRESLIHLNQHVQIEVIGRLLTGNRQLEPAGLTLDEAAAKERLAARGDLEIVPAADAVAAPAARKWNAWSDGKYSFIETGVGTGKTDGSLFNGLAGVDYKITDTFVAGLLGSFEASDLDTASLLKTTTKTEGLGGGAYLGLALTDTLVLGATVVGSHINTDVGTGGITANINSDRIQISSGLTGYLYSGSWRLTPLVNIAYSREWQDAYVDSGGAAAAAQTFESGVLSIGNQVGYTFTAESGMTVEPWVGGQFDYTFLDRTKESGLAALEAVDTLDFRAQAGLNVSIAENIQFSVLGDLSGLLLEDNTIYAVDAVLAVQF